MLHQLVMFVVINILQVHVLALAAHILKFYKFTEGNSVETKVKGHGLFYRKQLYYGQNVTVEEKGIKKKTH